MATVGELREWLDGLDDDRLVVLSKDGEGNEFSPLAGYFPDAVYRPESTWSGYLYDEEDDRLIWPDDEEFELPEGIVDAVVLWPTN